MASIDDVARLAGVSTATVSRTLSRRGNVSEETRRRVLDAAEALDYVVSSRASGLASGRTRNIGVIVPYLDRMDLAFALADAVVARSGAATVSELTALGIPAVYVPYAVGNGEQALNAASAVAAGAARLIPDAEFTPDRVRGEVVPLLADPEALGVLRAAAEASAPAARAGTAAVVAQIDEALGRSAR